MFLVFAETRRIVYIQQSQQKEKNVHVYLGKVGNHHMALLSEVYQLMEVHYNIPVIILFQNQY